MKGCDVLRAALQLSYSYEGEPAQVNQYCPRIWQIDPDLLRAILARWPGPFTLRREAVRIPLDAQKARLKRGQRLGEILAARQHSATLEISGVEAEEQPGVSYEVYLGPPGLKPDPRSRHFVGVFGMFSGGIKTKKHHYFPADVVFPIDKALSTVRDPAQMEIMLVPTDGLEESGRYQKGPPTPRAALSIREIRISTDAAAPQPPQDEQEELRRKEEVG